MEFRRIEVRRLLRYREIIEDNNEIRGILEELRKNQMEFTVKIQGMGGKLSRCTIVSLQEDKASLYAQHPSKVRLSPKYSEIEQVEVESNCDFIAEQNDDGGRWSRLM